MDQASFRTDATFSHSYWLSNSTYRHHFENSLVNLDYELISALYAVEYCTRATIIVVGVHDDQTNDDTDHSIGDYETYLEYLNLVGCWNEANREEKYNVSLLQDILLSSNCSTMTKSRLVKLHHLVPQ